MTPTRSGVAVGVAALLLAGAGLAAGYPELLMLAFGCAAALAAAAVWCAAVRSRLAARSDYLPRRPRQGEQVRAAIRVVNLGRRRSAPVSATETVDGTRYAVRVPPLPPRGEYVAEYAFPARRRGLVAVHRAEIAGADPLGLLRTRLAQPQDTQIRVHPRWHAGVVPLIAAEARSGRPLAGRPRDEADLHSLRDYQRGDPVRLMHWPSTARRGVMTVRRVESPEEPLQVLLLDNAAEAYTEDAFEDAVRIAASLAVAARQAGLGLELRTSRGPEASLRLARTGRPGGYTAALDLLSEVRLVARSAVGGAAAAAVTARSTAAEPGAGDAAAPAATAAAAGAGASRGFAPRSLLLPQSAAVLGIVTGRLTGSAAEAVAAAGRRAQAVYVVQVGADLPRLHFGGLVHLRVGNSAAFVPAWQRVVKR